MQDRRPHAFTLIELLVVITIIVVLMGLLFPAFRGVQDQAKRTQAKNDLTQIVTAVNAFYTEYGRYPTTGTTDAAATFGPGQAANNNVLFTPLRALETSSPTMLNPRQIAFITPPNVKDASSPRAGIATQDATVNGISIRTGDWLDPWGMPYLIALDGDYSGFVQVGTGLNYTDLNYSTDPPSGGPAAVQGGVISGSYGKDQIKGTRTPPSSNFKSSDDVISWQ